MVLGLIKHNHNKCRCECCKRECEYCKRRHKKPIWDRRPPLGDRFRERPKHYSIR